jgi:uncharacterized protein
MKLTPNIEIIDLALYLKKEKTLIIADAHIGYEEALNKQGIMIPRTAFKELIIRLENILKKVKPINIVLNGDIKHEFGQISKTEWRNTLKLIDFLQKNCKNLILIKGNHDKILDPIAKKKNITITDQLILNNTIITHGHKLIKPDKKIKTIIIGHEHPAITLGDLARKEKYKCFLKGKWKNKTLIVQPSLKLISEGTDITKARVISPFLKQDFKNFEAFIIADEVYYFGKLKDLITK